MEEKNSYYTLVEGELCEVETSTGNILAREPRFEDSLVPGTPLAPKFIKGQGRTWNYTPVYKDLIMQWICEGETLTSICKRPGMPSLATLARWRAEHDELNDAIKMGRRMRAEGLADRVLDSLEEKMEAAETLNKDELATQRFYFDKLKWLTEKNDPDTYGNRVTHAGDANAPLTLVVDTGIRRDTLPEPTTVEEQESNDVVETTSKEIQTIEGDPL